MRTPYLCVSSTVLALALSACGGGESSSPPPAAPTASASGATPSGPPLPTKPDSAKVTWKQDPSLAKCHNDVKTGKDLVAGVTAMATACASTGGKPMKQIGDTVQGSRQNMDPPQAIPLHAEANHCYRVYGLSEDALQDLDIAMIDSANKACGEDGSDSPDAVVLENGAICFTQTDDVKVNVAAGAGAGKFAVQIWGD
jgi:hypothetical protein